LGAVAVTKLGRNHPQSFILRLLVVIQLYIISIIFRCVGVLNADRGWSVLCGILLNVMDKNSVFHLKRGRGEKGIVSANKK